jgi:hypothetical protein
MVRKWTPAITSLLAKVWRLQFQGNSLAFASSSAPETDRLNLEEICCSGGKGRRVKHCNGGYEALGQIFPKLSGILEE